MHDAFTSGFSGNGPLVNLHALAFNFGKLARSEPATCTLRRIVMRCFYDAPILSENNETLNAITAQLIACS